MRYQEPNINEFDFLKNRVKPNYNFSSDVLLFNKPIFNLLDVDKLDCNSTTTSVFLNTNESINFQVTFIENVNTIIDFGLNFNLNLYRYNTLTNKFENEPYIIGDVLNYGDLSGLTFNNLFNFSNTELDADYLIRVNYSGNSKTDFLSNFTIPFTTNKKIIKYDDTYDYFISVIQKADKPILTDNSSNINTNNTLTQQIIETFDNQTQYGLPQLITNNVIITLNGLVLSQDYDYSINGNLLNLSGETFSDDILTVIYNTNNNYNLVTDYYEISTPIVSGSTNTQLGNIFYNNDTNKFELFTSIEPLDVSNILVMINGVTLANGVDFYQSTTNSKRIILEGEIILGDIITIVYYPITSTSNSLNTNIPLVSWRIETPPKTDLGVFVLEVSLDESFTSLYYSGVTQYIVNDLYYSQSFNVNKPYGTKLYYRVKNIKKYKNICGNILEDVSYSDTIKLVVQTNNINSY